jgi:RNA polymerase sigma-70 factor (ECF subfamily)
VIRLLFFNNFEVWDGTSSKFFLLLDHPLDNEKVLLKMIAAGDERAFRQLFDLYKERFYAVALKMTGCDEVTKDIVQDTFMNIWNKRESLADIENPSAYFFTAVYRRVYHHYRKVAHEKKLLEEASPIHASVNTTEEMVLAHESNELISEAFEKLPPQQKLVFRLSRQEGLSREDVALRLHISPNTVKNHLAEALKFIRAFLRSSEATFLIIFWFT